MKGKWKYFAAFLLCLDVLLLGLDVLLLKDGSSPPAPAPTGSEQPRTEAEAEPVSTAAVQAVGSPEPDGSPDEIGSLLSRLSLEEKVGQLFIIRPDSLDFTQSQEQINDASAPGVTGVTDAMAAAMGEYPIGGIVLFGKNIAEPGQLSAFTAALQGSSKLLLFIAVDEEGGTVSRLANHPGFDLPKYESAAAVGAGEDPGQALEMGRTIGAYLRQYGFNMDFAPDADVNTNPQNPIIGTRAFSPNADTAAQMAAAMAEGLRENGVVPVFKHFPGHGDTAEDSHNRCAVSNKTGVEMAACEWLPFMEASAIDGVMVGHIAAPNLTGDMAPASLSHMMVTDILKGQLGFQGLVITDSLAMDAVARELTPGEAAVQALEAGCDLILMPNGLAEAYQAVLDAVAEGRISPERINESVRKILEIKLAYGILP